MAVLFNFIPGAGLIAPGRFFERNSAGQFDSVSWTLVMGHKSSAGTIPNDSPRLCTTVQEAGQLAGNGSQLYELFRKARRAAPAATIYMVAVPATGTAPAWTATIGALAAGGGTAILEIAGRRVTIAVAAGETAATTATNLAAAVNAFVDPVTLEYLPVTATAATNIVTLTARHAGTTMNEIEIIADGAIPGNLFSTTNVTVAQTATAAGTANISAALGAMGDLPFHWILSPFGDDASITSARAALSDVSGRWAYNQQLYGHYFTVRTDTTGNLTTLGLSLNDDHVTVLGRFASPSPSWEWLGGMVGRILPWLSDSTNGNAARNQSDLVAEGVRPPRDRTTWPTNYATRNALLGSGISTWAVNGAGEVVIDKLITTRRNNAAGQPDSTFRDIQTIAVAMHSLIYLRAGLSYRHANKAIADQNSSNVPTISTPADIKSDLIALYGDLVDRGLMENRAAFAAALVVERDAVTRSRVNIALNAMDVVNPLDILAANATFRS